MNMHELTGAVESILFVSTKPISIKKLALHLNASIADIRAVLDELAQLYTAERGIILIEHDSSVQFATNSAYSEIMRTLLKTENTGELTRSAVETLSIIAYRGPITKEEIEQIRGVNCSIALRNLSIRGLIESKEDALNGIISYLPTFDFLRHLGVNSLDHLPEYEHFHNQTFAQPNNTSAE